MNNGKKIKGFFLIMALTLTGSSAYAQSTPSPEVNCGEYLWPEVTVPCPEVQIKQKHDHTPQARYRQAGWDTVVTCDTPQIVLSCTPYIPAKLFNGTYYVDEIPYNPTDTTFYINYPGYDLPLLKKIPIQNDDDFTDNPTPLGFPFYFFGIKKNQFTIGDNGIVTFTTTPMAGPNPFCPYAVNTPIPWNSNNNYGGFSSYIDRTHDAIYGVYEDTYTGVNGALMDQTANPHCGIYYGVVDEYPCRKIIASWKSIPLYGNNSVRNTYQIVCYEGSNIIEVHIEHHGCCPSTSSGVIGIQNATGLPQVPSSTPGASNSSPAIQGKPAAFFPIGYNLTTSTFEHKSFRFTPAGNTPANYHWYRIFDDGRDSIELKNPQIDPSAYDDTNGYYTPMVSTSACPTLTKAYVSPKVTSHYVFHMKFQNVNGDWYNLYDTITVGVDTLKLLTLTPATPAGADDHVLNVCQNDLATMMYTMTSIQDTANTQWTLTRVNNGDTTVLDNSLISFSSMADDGTYKTMPFTINTQQIPNPPVNKIDSIYIQCIANFTSGCYNYDVMLLRIFPNFDTTTVAGICRGEKYHWSANNRDYTESTNPATEVAHLLSQPECDSTVRLDLTVFDVSYTIDSIVDCKPIVWINGKTYSESNTATALQDTVVLKNIYDCDSIIQLDFTIHPLTAKIESNIKNFTLDNLDAILTDVSIGGNSRVWKFPTTADQTGPVAYYSIPAELDGANIILIESSEFGCIDTATLYLPLNKESFWVPNAFTPDNPAGNNLFGTVSSKTLRQEMIIYNRRGEMVFHCQSVDCAWDGRDLNGTPCVQGAYVYVIRYTNEYEPNQTKVLTGSVTLIR